MYFPNCNFFLRRVTFHYKRSSLSYFGGVCSRTRGVGVNEVNFVNFPKVELYLCILYDLFFPYGPVYIPSQACLE